MKWLFLAADAVLTLAIRVNDWRAERRAKRRSGGKRG